MFQILNLVYSGGLLGFLINTKIGKLHVRNHPMINHVQFGLITFFYIYSRLNFRFPK